MFEVLILEIVDNLILAHRCRRGPSTPTVSHSAHASGFRVRAFGAPRNDSGGYFKLSGVTMRSKSMRLAREPVKELVLPGPKAEPAGWTPNCTEPLP